MVSKKKSSKAKTKVSQVFQQAKASLKLAKFLEKSTFAKAKEMRDERIMESLNKLGVATRDELATLRAQVERLEAELAAVRASIGIEPARAPGLASDLGSARRSEPEALPRG